MPNKIRFGWSERRKRFVVKFYVRGRSNPYQRATDLMDLPLLTEVHAHATALHIDQEFEAAEKQGLPIPVWKYFNTKSDFCFDRYLDLWWKKHRKNLAPRCQKDAERYLRLMLKHFKKIDIRNVKTGHIEDFLDSKPLAHYAPATWNQIRGYLRSIFLYAEHREEIPRAPKFPTTRKIPDKPIHTMLLERREQVISAIPKADQPIFRFLAAYACRPGEARALMWEDFDWPGRIILIRRTWHGGILRPHRKGGDQLEVPLFDQIEKMLKPVRGISGFVFRRNGKPYKDTLNHTWQWYQKKVGVPKSERLSLYESMRHTTGSDLISQGYSESFVQALLGHKSAAMTRRYARVKLGAIREMLEAQVSNAQ